MCSDATEASEWIQPAVTGDDSSSAEGALYDAEGTSLSCCTNADLSCEEVFTPVYSQISLALTEFGVSKAALTAISDDPDQEALRDIQVLFR